MRFPSIDWQGFGRTRGWTTTWLWQPEIERHLYKPQLDATSTKAVQFGDWSTYTIRERPLRRWQIYSRWKRRRWARVHQTRRVTIPAGEGGTYLVSASATFTDGGTSHRSGVIHLADGGHIEARVRSAPPAPPDPPEST